MLSSSSSGTESPCLTGQTRSSSFTPVNFKSRFSGTKPFSPFMRHAETPGPAGPTNSSGFTPINSGLHISETESPSLPMRHKKAGIKGKSAAAIDADYDPPI